MNRRLMSIFAVLCLAAVSACGRCDTSNECTGEAGACCRTPLFGISACDEDLYCVDGTCELCGAAGQPCCELWQCSTRNQCLRIDGEYSCSDCGEPGEPCCTSDAGASCSGFNNCELSTSTCVEPPGSECAGATPRTYWGRFDSGCATPPEDPWVEWADDPNVSEACARTNLRTGDVRSDPPAYHDICEDPPFGPCLPQRRPAFSESDALACARATCGPRCSLTAGPCPADGTCPSDP